MFWKWYARLKSIETLSTEKLAKHISEHGSVFTADVVEGVMKKVKTCLLEMLLESKKVKIAGLGTFYLTCECQKGGTDNTGGGTNTGGGSDDTGGDDDGDDGLDKD